MIITVVANAHGGNFSPKHSLEPFPNFSFEFQHTLCESPDGSRKCRQSTP